MTKVIAINGSARMEKGNTELVLSSFLDGMREAGASVEVVYAKKLKIRPCIGDFQCWYEKVGECIHSDDMRCKHLGTSNTSLSSPTRRISKSFEQTHANM